MTVYTCNECGKDFNRKHAFDYHLEKEVCTREKPNNTHICLCGSGFTTKSNLTRHIKKCEISNNEEVKKLQEKVKNQKRNIGNKGNKEEKIIINKDDLEDIIIRKINEIKEQKVRKIEEQIKDKRTEENQRTEYIYLLQEREFKKTNEPIYKIGKTKQKNLGRIQNYSNGTILLIQMKCNNCDIMERNLINIFKNKYQQETSIGLEYFYGNADDMIEDIINNILLEKQNINKIDEKEENETLIVN